MITKILIKNYGACFRLIEQINRKKSNIVKILKEGDDKKVTIFTNVWELKPEYKTLATKLKLKIEKLFIKKDILIGEINKLLESSIDIGNLNTLTEYEEFIINKILILNSSITPRELDLEQKGKISYSLKNKRDNISKYERIRYSIKYFKELHNYDNDIINHIIYHTKKEKTRIQNDIDKVNIDIEKIRKELRPLKKSVENMDEQYKEFKSKMVKEYKYLPIEIHGIYPCKGTELHMYCVCEIEDKYLEGIKNPMIYSIESMTHLYIGEGYPLTDSMIHKDETLSLMNLDIDSSKLNSFLFGPLIIKCKTENGIKRISGHGYRFDIKSKYLPNKSNCLNILYKGKYISIPLASIEHFETSMY